MVLHPSLQQFKIIPDVHEIIYPTMTFSFKICEVCPSTSTFRFHAALKLCNTLVEEIVIPCPNIYEYPLLQHFTKIQLVVPVCRYIFCKIHMLPVLDGA